MVSEQVQFDLSVDLDEGNYKSCFARSVAVNSQYKQTKPQVVKKVEKEMDTSSSNHFDKAKNVFVRSSPAAGDNVEVKLRKSTRSCTADSRRMSLGAMNGSRRSSICSSRVTEIPVENIVHQSKIETLQWQLKEAEKSREMYRALMVQIVTFLERAHRSLELLGTKMNSKQTVSRSKSEHQIMADSSTLDNHSKTLDNTTCTEDYTAFRDFTWRRPKKQEISPEEIPPEKLSQEAFRLLRTAQSLLNTREPDLAHVNNEPEDDLEFLAQLAKEFPQSQTPEVKPQRTTSFSLSPKLITPERETKISSAFNRKLSLQFSEAKRYNNMYRFSRQTDSARGSIVESENGNDFNKDHRSSMISTHSYAAEKLKLDCEKSSSSPPAGSISSVEDESGFSSMNSFQDVGLPLVNSTVSEDVNSKNVIMRNMMHSSIWNGNICTHNQGPNSHLESVEEKQPFQDNLDDIKLWKKPDNIIPNHKRWSSTPVKKNEKQTREVLWV